jgi:hypothetical protein
MNRPHRTRRQLLYALLVFLGLSVGVAPFLIAYAQKERTAEKPHQDENLNKARLEVKKSIVGSMLLDSMLIKEADWKLNKAGFLEMSDGTSISIQFKNGDTYVGVAISEYDSVEIAEARFNALRSYGASVLTSGFGDKSDKLIGDRGDLMALRFRKGNYFVDIFTHDLKAAERFANHISKVLTDSGVK